MSRRAPSTGPGIGPGSVTSVPYLGSARAPRAPRNHLMTKANASMARRVHGAGLVLLATLGGCVIPPPLQTDQPDAGANHPPSFRSVRDGTGEELVRPGPHTFVVGSGELRITAADTDVGDTLFFRMYVDYGIERQTPVRAECMAAPGPTPTLERTTTCSLIGVCSDDLADTLTHVFELDVLDRQPASTVNRMYRDVTEPGEIATYWWNIICERAAS